MTDYITNEDDQIGRLFENMAADIGRAPVEPWLKAEALARLNRIEQVTSALEVKLEAKMKGAPVDYAWVDENAKDNPVESKGESEIFTDSPDDRWQRMQIVELAAKVYGSFPHDEERNFVLFAREIEEYVTNG